MSGYSNVGSSCLKCGDCCDDPLIPHHSTCTGEDRCDNVFFYCLRRLGSPLPQVDYVRLSSFRKTVSRANELGCTQPSIALRSHVNLNSVFVNFNSDTVLGLPNPLVFEVTADRWQVSHCLSYVAYQILRPSSPTPEKSKKPSGITKVKEGLGMRLYCTC